jgi:hypothetical protein
MSRRLFVLTFTLAACSPLDPLNPPASARRDALPGDQTFDLPLATGLLPGDRLGEHVVDCDDEFYATGSAGVMWAESTPLVFLATSPEVRAPSCLGFGSGHQALVGGNTGLWKLAVGWQRLLNDAGIEAVDRNPSQPLWLLSTGTNLELMFADAGRISVGIPARNAKWDRDGQTFAAVSATNLQLFAWNGALSMGPAWPPPSNTQFLGPVAIGEFNPRSGLEFAAVLDTNEVVVFNEFLTTPLLRLPFGSTVATDYDFLSNGDQLDALLVGEPGSSRVQLMVGDASVEAWATTSSNTGFGTAVATKTTVGASRMVGAPAWTANAGAVFLIPRSLTNLIGDPFECIAGQDCSTPSGSAGSCNYGTCLGGVACIGLTPDCPSGWTCVVDVCVPNGTRPDAGADGGIFFDDGGLFVDAGRPDASTSFDAGVDAGTDRDAGASTDAGTSADAGPQTDGGTKPRDDGGTADAGSSPTAFEATGCLGCSSAGFDVLALLGLLSGIRASRRRRGTYC